MTQTEHANRARKAIAIADTLQAVDCDSATAAQLTDAAWQTAARAAAARIAETEHVPAPKWTDASQTTRGMVLALLADREQTTTEDLFEAFKAGETAVAPIVPEPAADDEHLSGKIIAALVATPGPARETIRCVCGHGRPAHRGTDGEGDPLSHCRATKCGCPSYDTEPDDFRSWCLVYDVDPEGPHAHGLYQDWLSDDGILAGMVSALVHTPPVSGFSPDAEARIAALPDGELHAKGELIGLHPEERMQELVRLLSQEADRKAKVRAAEAAMADPDPPNPAPISGLHTLNCAATGGHCKPGAPCTDPPFTPAHRRQETQ